MTQAEAVADVFVTAIKSLPKAKRDAVLARLAADKSLVRDIIDLATIADRRNEPSRPFRHYLAKRARR